MSVARARELLDRIAADPAFEAEIEKAPDGPAMRKVIDDAGFKDVTLDDVRQAVAPPGVGQAALDPQAQRRYTLGIRAASADDAHA